MLQNPLSGRGSDILPPGYARGWMVDSRTIRISPSSRAYVEMAYPWTESAGIPEDIYRLIQVTDDYDQAPQFGGEDQFYAIISMVQRASIHYLE